jgi:hypothetical protein
MARTNETKGKDDLLHAVDMITVVDIHKLTHSTHTHL